MGREGTLCLYDVRYRKNQLLLETHRICYTVALSLTHTFHAKLHNKFHFDFKIHHSESPFHVSFIQFSFSQTAFSKCLFFSFFSFLSRIAFVPMCSSFVRNANVDFSEIEISFLHSLSHTHRKLSLKPIPPAQGFSFSFFVDISQRYQSFFISHSLFFALYMCCFLSIHSVHGFYPKRSVCLV